MTTTALPPDETIQNRDGTKTTISYRFNEQGQTVKTTRRIRLITHREVVNPRVAERKKWPKFGLSANDGPGPASDTTSVGENIIFRPSANWKQEAKDEAKDPNAQSMKEKLKDKTVQCRICRGEHFTARCPYKETMAPVGETADVAAGMGDEPGVGGLSKMGAGGDPGVKKGSYVPPALRNKGGGGEGEKMGGKYSDRDDLATLRVTNVSVYCMFFFFSGRGASSIANNVQPRSPRWPRSRSSVTCLSASGGSRVCSWPRTGRQAGLRALHLSALQTGPTRCGRAARWTALVSSI